jgi:hypothetical protein
MVSLLADVCALSRVPSTPLMNACRALVLADAGPRSLRCLGSICQPVFEHVSRERGCVHDRLTAALPYAGGGVLDRFRARAPDR